MPRIVQLLIGPELLWLFYYLLIVLTIKVSGSPIKSMDNFWEKLIYVVPFIAVPLTFGLYWTPGVERSWLLLRIWVAALAGAHFVLEKGLGAYSEQGPGIGMGYLVGLMLALVFLVIGSIVVLIKF
ncbi:MAG: hypothetical protein IPM98_02925 [Lewinellaceae bacterium]|nr:hypothetical protein [Lewinellaceae bacterium]